MIKPIFLFSLPRSGSTLTQRIISSHKDIVTASEPWILLPYLYTFKSNGVYAEYSHKTMVTAINEFCKQLPNGKDDNLAEIREYILRVYSKFAIKGEKYFLDKTPRYHLIAGELIELFPDAKFIFLWRNPLSIVASIIETWGNSKWNLQEYKIDLFDGLKNLIEVYRKNSEISLALQYEDLINNSEVEGKKIFSYLELPYDQEVFKNFSQNNIKGAMGDMIGTRKYKSLNKEPLTKWKTILANPVRKAWCKNYLRTIGCEFLEIMGYDYDHLLKEIGDVPFKYKYFFSDIGRNILGTFYVALDAFIIKDKLRNLSSWHKIHWHT